MILETGFVQKPQRTVTRQMEKVDRDKLGLPRFREATDKFKTVLMKALGTF